MKRLRYSLIAAVAAIALSPASATETTLAGGTRVIETAAGSGAVAQPGSRVTVHYTGWLYQDGKRGKRFDSSRGGRPFTFTLGAGEVIPGWDAGVAGMKAGAQRTLILPPEAGYGAEGDDVIPANSWLIFDVELLEIE